MPHGSALGPVLHLLYIKDIPKKRNSAIDTFVDDNALLVIDSAIEVTTTLQKAVNKSPPGRVNGASN